MSKPRRQPPHKSRNLKWKFAAALVGLALGFLLLWPQARPPEPPPLRPAPVIAAVKPPPAAPVPVRPQPLWQANAQAAQPVKGRPAVVVVLDDMGVDRKRSARVIQLPGPLTLSFLPYGQDLGNQVAAARGHGHEIMLHLPMEPGGQEDPGPRALRLAQTPAERLAALDWALAQVDRPVGVNNHMGSRFTADEGAMAPLIAHLAQRGLLWLDSRTTARTAGTRLAGQHGLPILERDVFLDDDPEGLAVHQQMDRLEKIARSHGAAIAIGHPRDATIAELERWLPTLTARGLALVPLTAVAAQRMSGR